MFHKKSLLTIPFLLLSSSTYANQLSVEELRLEKAAIMPDVINVFTNNIDNFKHT